jgi:hypothetical protein
MQLWGSLSSGQAAVLSADATVWSAIGSFLAVLVALGLAIGPRLADRRNDEKRVRSLGRDTLALCHELDACFDDIRSPGPDEWADLQQRAARLERLARILVEQSRLPAHLAYVLIDVHMLAQSCAGTAWAAYTDRDSARHDRYRDPWDWQVRQDRLAGELGRFKAASG